MLFEGMPWPLVIPIALIALIYGIIVSKKEERSFDDPNNTEKKEK